MWKRFDKDLGLLVIRGGMGIMFVLYGYPKITGGVEFWTQLGGSMSKLGITFMPTFWGFMASLSEFGGGILLIAGFLFRPALLLMIFTMFVAFLVLHSKGGMYLEWLTPIENALVFIGLFIAGSGKYALKINK
jgi:putative oxidoreductase